MELTSSKLEALAAAARASKTPGSEAVVHQWARDAAHRGDEVTSAVAAMLFGAREIDLGHNAEGLRSLEAAHAIAQRAGVSALELATLREWARGLTVVSRFADALEIASRGLALARVLEVPQVEVLLVINVGMTHAYRDEPEPYAEHMTYALKLARALDDKRLIAHCSINLGGALTRQQKADAALECYAEAERCCATIDWREGEALLLAGRGAVFAWQGRLDDSEASFQTSNAILRELGNDYQVVRQEQQFIGFCLSAKDPQRALEHARAGIALSEAGRFEGLAAELYRLVAQAHEQLGEFREAFDALNRATALREQLLENASSERLAALQAEHRVDVARAAAAQAQSEALALSKANDMLRSLLDALPHAVFVFGAQRTLWMNSAAQAWLGQPGLTLLGEGLFDRIVVSKSHRERLQFERLRGEPTALLTVSMRLPSGAMRDVEVNSCALDFEGEPAVVLALHDLTERNRLEARVQHLDRLTALSTLVGGISHEVNNPLAYIIANLNFALSELSHLNLPAEDERLCALREAEEGAVRVRTVMQGLKALAASPGRTQVTESLVAVLREAAALVQASIGTSPMIALCIEADDARVKGADSQLVQVFVNLLMHAVASTQGLTDRAASIEVVFDECTSEHARVIVRDNGHGHDDARRRRLFDPYAGVEHITPGSGLSVSIALRTVQALGGHIDADSVEGVGTALTIVLPCLGSQDEVNERSV